MCVVCVLGSWVGVCVCVRGAQRFAAHLFVKDVLSRTAQGARHPLVKLGVMRFNASLLKLNAVKRTPNADQKSITSPAADTELRAQIKNERKKEREDGKIYSHLRSSVCS